MSSDVALFDRFARPYDLLSPPVRRALLREAVARAERPLERVADVGGGPGQAVASLDVPTRIVIDPALGMLRRARRRGLWTVQADGARLPFATDSLDGIVVTDALHHIGDADGVLAEAGRVIAPGGVLVIRDFDPTTLRGRALVAMEHLVGFDSTFVPPDRLADRIASAGFRASVLERGFSFTVLGVALPAESGTPKG